MVSVKVTVVFSFGFDSSIMRCFLFILKRIYTNNKISKSQNAAASGGLLSITSSDPECFLL